MADHKDLPRAYLASCKKFFKSLKRQAASPKELDSHKIPDIK